MSASSLALQQAIHARLAADAGLTGLLGGAHIFDDVPQGKALPYVTLGQTSVRDWSTGTEDGEEHTLTLHVWSSSAGRREALRLAAAIRDALAAAPLSPVGCHLVQLAYEFCEVRRDAGGEAYHGLVRYRAVTEEI